METVQPTMFADLLRRYRLAAGLTQEELAARARVSRKAVSALECGARVSPRRDTVRLLADGLGLPLEERAALAAVATSRPHTVPSVPPTHAATHPAPPSNLPAPPTPLIGREREVADAQEALRRGDASRLLTLVGPAGVGKTRLGLAVAAEILPDVADGVFLVVLAPLTDPTLVAAAIAGALGLHERGGQPLQEALVAYLRDKRILLLLDNFEHVVAAAPVLADLLAACPHLRLLVTSRSPVHVRGERVRPVPPLAVPDPASMPPLDTLATIPAVALFVERATAVAPDFALVSENAVAVAAICRRLDGLPLAIELAAARVTLLPPHALLERLEYRLPLLVGGACDLPERQQTLRAAIAWSYDLLHAGEQALFRRLGVFAGGVALAAVEAVCGVGGDLEGDALAWLTGLVDKSLLQRAEGPGGEPRVGMLETLREYARERLVAHGELEATERAHAAYYLALAERAEPELTGPGQAVWLARLEREHDNLRAALRWSREGGEVEVGLRLAGALWRFWYTRGHISEGRRWLEPLLDDRREAVSTVRARALNGAGNLAWVHGDYARARTAHEKSLTLRRALRDTQGIAMALGNLGLVAKATGDLQPIRKIVREAYAAAERVFRHFPDRLLAQARRLLQESLALWRELGDTWGIALALSNLGLVIQNQGDDGLAEALYTESLALRQQRGDTAGIALSLDNLGNLAYMQGNLARAKTLHEESLTLKREVGDVGGAMASLMNLWLVTAAQGNAQSKIARVRVLIEENLTLINECGNTADIVNFVEELAEVVAKEGQPAKAARLLGTAAARRAATGAARLPRDQTSYDCTVITVRAALGEKAFATTWAAGAALSLEQAVALVREE